MVGIRNIVVLSAVLGVAIAAGSQAAPAPIDPGQTSAVVPQPTPSEPTIVPVTAVVADVPPSQDSNTPTKKTYTVPAGTKVLLRLESAINTRSAKAGDGVYLASTFPVVVGSKVMIPAGVYVQGVVDTVARAGRVKGRAQLNLHFTSIIFPNGTVMEIPGIINSLPGAKDHTVDAEGKVEERSNRGHAMANAAKIGLEGAGIGTIGGAATGHPLEGLAIGGLSGAAVGAVAALFTRGDDINIDSGTPVEMVLQRPLVLEEENFSSNIPEGGTAPTFVPSANQVRPMNKPAIHRSQMVCPAGTLGCS